MTLEELRQKAKAAFAIENEARLNFDDIKKERITAVSKYNIAACEAAGITSNETIVESPEWGFGRRTVRGVVTGISSRWPE